MRCVSESKQRERTAKFVWMLRDLYLRICCTVNRHADVEEADKADAAASSLHTAVPRKIWMHFIGRCHSNSSSYHRSDWLVDMIKCKQKRKCAHRTQPFECSSINAGTMNLSGCDSRRGAVRIDFDFVGFSSIVNIYGSMISCRTHSRNIAWTRVHEPTVLLNIMFLFIAGIRRRTPYSSPFVRRALSVRLVCMWDLRCKNDGHGFAWVLRVPSVNHTEIGA